VYHHLDESRGFRRVFPWRGTLAGGKADDHVADAARLARLHLDIARDIVALVEQRDGRHAVLHRRADAVHGGRRRRRVGYFLGNLGRFGLRFRRFAGAARDKRHGGPKRNDRDRERLHASGVQAS